MPTVPQDALAATRSALHGIVETVMSGPQHRESGTIWLRVVPGAVETVAAPPVRLTPEEVSGHGGEASLLGPTTLRAVAAAVGVAGGAPDGLYPGRAPLGLDAPFEIDHEVATALFDWFAVGAAALLQIAPESRAVLRPERFDLAITLDGVDYGVSPGDDRRPQPYAFVRSLPQGEGSAAVRLWDAVPDTASLVDFLTHEREQRRVG